MSAIGTQRDYPETPRRFTVGDLALTSAGLVGAIVVSAGAGLLVVAASVGAIALVLGIAAVGAGVLNFRRAISLVIIAETFMPIVSGRSRLLSAGAPVGIALLAMLILSVMVTSVLSTRRAAWTWTGVDIAAVAFIILCGLNVVASSDRHVALDGFRDQTKYLVIFLCVRAAGQTLSPDDGRRIVRLVFGLFVLIALVGVAEYFLDYGLLARLGRLPTTFSDQYMGTGIFSPDGGGYFVPQHRRLYSLLASPLFTAYAATGGALMAAAMLVFGPLKRRMAVALLALFGLCLALTYTRSAIIGLFAGLIALWLLTPSGRFGVRTSKLRVLLTLVAALAAAMAMLYAAAPSLLRYPLSIVSSDPVVTNNHYRFLGEDWQFLITHPWGAGIGRASLQLLSNEPGQLVTWTESWYFYVTAELGVMGGILFMLVCVLGLRQAVRQARRPVVRRAGDAWAAPAIVAWFVALLAAGIAGVPFFSWMISASAWTLLALLVNAEQRDLRDYPAERLGATD